MKKTRKISMIPEFLRNRKTYMLTALVFTIIGVLSLSFAFFNFNRDADLTSQNVVMLETVTIDDITKSFTVSYEKNNASLETGILDISSTYSDIMKFKVESNYSDSQLISINWNFITSTLTKSATSYTLYSCNSTNFLNATVDNVASLCTAISPTTGNVLPNSNEKYKLTSAANITLPALSTQYYVAKINIEASNTGKSFTGTIAVKHTKYSTLTLDLADGTISCSLVSDMPFGDTRTIPIPTKSGYIFSGWVIDGETDSVVNAYEFTMGTSDTTLIATWTATVRNFMYNGTTGSDGSYQLFTTPQTGMYKIEAWGASGKTNGYGSYTKGKIYLEKNQKLYVYVGGRGNSIYGGYNGGGNGGTGGSNNGGGGGGATDIRYFSNEPSNEELIWNNELGLNSRIMVAAAGGGGYNSGASVGTGGGLNSYIGSIGKTIAAYQSYYGIKNPSSGTATTSGSFGIGGDGGNLICCGGGAGGGGGGGYYGGAGGSGYQNTDVYDGGGGGSSYISGHIGSSSILSSQSRIHTGSAIHYSQKYFLDTQMIDGKGYSWGNTKDGVTPMPNPNGLTYEANVGNIGDGYAKITFLNYDLKNNQIINEEILTILQENNYYYSNNYQIFITPQTGTYKVEMWGASGVTNGYGAYTKGEISLQKDDKYYIYVGGDSNSIISSNGGYNGGGDTTCGGQNPCGGGGGGATDIRYFSNEPTSEELLWNSDLGLNSRIMVAAGGGGGYSGNSTGGVGGGIDGTTGTRSYSTNANQIRFGTRNASAGDGTTSGSFGTGGHGGNCIVFYGGAGGGGGGGYYGGAGGSGYQNTDVYDGGGGGSSYISGHKGCVAIADLFDVYAPRTPLTNCTSGSSNILCSYHINGKVFTNTKIIDGNGYNWTNIKESIIQMPNPNGGSYATNGNIGKGFARITRIS